MQNPSVKRTWSSHPSLITSNEMPLLHCCTDAAQLPGRLPHKVDSCCPSHPGALGLWSNLMSPVIKQANPSWVFLKPLEKFSTCASVTWWRVTGCWSQGGTRLSAGLTREIMGPFIMVYSIVPDVTKHSADLTLDMMSPTSTETMSALAFTGTQPSLRW